jgi:hypothetical protein
MALMALVAQKIWFRKNAFVFEEKFAHSKIIFEEATTACVEFHQCNSHPVSQASPARGVHGPSHPWQPPPRARAVLGLGV